MDEKWRSVEEAEIAKLKSDIFSQAENIYSSLVGDNPTAEYLKKALSFMQDICIMAAAFEQTHNNIGRVGIGDERRCNEPLQ